MVLVAVTKSWGIPLTDGFYMQLISKQPKQIKTVMHESLCRYSTNMQYNRNNRASFADQTVNKKTSKKTSILHLLYLLPQQETARVIRPHRGGQKGREDNVCAMMLWPDYVFFRAAVLFFRRGRMLENTWSL